ncbi:polysaccharide export protein [Mucilaginibacter robiniae]|uniref:Polysaccharide export protein n=1 Tax=Mucilaginibacter robiniae TaxID=2728022 RepID=A0A7L5DYT2_9SPHI|nr:polysaccharide biosynthesis/export family protein [Mucilaginibacter robiniae]QJD94414.1 polysaccharide export protein [Mucilaginibacter robiniae]
MNKTSIFFSILVMFLFSSCGSYKEIPYFQDLDSSRPSQEKVNNYSPVAIKPADILSIIVSSRNPESSAIFNFPSVASSSNPEDYLNKGYLVDDQGMISLPLVGVMKVSGLTTSQLRAKLRDTLLTYYKDPVVNVRIINMNVSVFGDVLRPNVYSLQNERTTITQALTMAGDLNITAKRKNIILIREENGERKYINIDLTSKKIFDSPYYYLKNNDEIYVQPDRTKYATVDRGYRIATLVLSGLSIIAIVLSNLYR